MKKSLFRFAMFLVTFISSFVFFIAAMAVGIDLYDMSECKTLLIVTGIISTIGYIFFEVTTESNKDAK